jgi:hypothetical protein
LAAQAADSFSWKQKVKWICYRRQGKLPPERRLVLVMIQERPGHLGKDAATVAVGYIRIHSNGPFFVVPGVPHKDEHITHYNDCLGDDFKAPLWLCEQVKGELKRRWFKP